MPKKYKCLDCDKICQGARCLKCHREDRRRKSLKKKDIHRENKKSICIDCGNRCTLIRCLKCSKRNRKRNSKID